jgi:DNA repair protein RadC
MGVSEPDDLTLRLHRLGVGSLAPMELLAVLMGGQGDDLNRARKLVESVGGIRKLVDLCREDLLEQEIEEEAMARVLAAIELGRRVMQSGLGERTTIGDPADVAAEFRHLRDEKKEHFCAIFLDSKSNILRRKTISIGALDAAVVHPREVFRDAIKEGAASIIVAHNHPSGDPEPSHEDINVTRRLADAGRILGIELLDHVILGEDRHVSLQERGYL